MTRVRIEIDRDGIGDLLASSEVQRVLDGKAERVADAARGRGITVEGKPGDVPLPVNVVDASTSDRARALVTIDHPAAMAVEAKHRLLVGSLDAARD